MSASRLEARIATLRNRVRRLLAVRGLSWVVGLLVPIVILLGMADWAVHLDAVVRVAALAALAGFAGYLSWRYVIKPLIVRFNDLDIALRIEERWPGLNDRLASTVQFLRLAEVGDDDRFGSAALREATVRQTMEETETIDFRTVIEPRPVFRALALAAGSLVVASAIIVATPELSKIAMRRLFLPFGPDRWPQQTHLTLIDGETPRKVARGDAFTLAVTIAKGERAPASARALYHFDDGETVTESLRAVEGGIFRGRIEAVNRPFTFSVAAGDDTTSVRDIAVKVVPPPTLKDLIVRLISPPYTGLAPQTMAPGRNQIRAVVGTTIEVEALANKPIERAELHLGEKTAATPVAFDPARLVMKTQFTLADSVPFWFELRDTEGFRNREAIRTDVRSFHDEAPRVTIEEPSHDRDVPAKATVPVLFTVDDDFGIQSARMLYKVASGGSEPTQEVALPLWEAPHDRGNGSGPVKRQEVRYEWNLAPLNLTPGAIITFHADARDFDDIKGPNLGKSREIRLRVLSDEDILRELDDARREIRDETARILAMQKQALTPVQDALRTIAKTRQADALNRDELKNAAMIQRQVGSRITSQADGLDQKIRRFLDDLKNFKIPNPDAQKQMEQMQAGVDEIRQQHLGPAEQGLTRASKGLEGNPEATPPRGQGERAPEADPGPSTPKPDEPKPDAADAGGDKTAPDARGAKPAPAAKGEKPSPDAAGNPPPEGQAPGDQAKEAGRPGEGEQAKAKAKDNAKAQSKPERPGGKPEAGPPKRAAEPTQAALKEAETNQ
ncbi:MAG: hypothetical protein QOE66_2898, partial [Chloroflexota bacterium]|nr:hypothetical protein [Chloroflexota bacterium]